LRENTSNTFNTLVETTAYRQAIINSRPNTLTAKILGASGVEPRVVQVLGGSCASAGINIPCQVVGNGFDVGSPFGAYGTYNSLGNPSGGGLDGIADLQFVQASNPNNFKGNQYFSRVDYDVTRKDKIAVSLFIVPSSAFTSDTSAQARPMADINSKRLSYALGLIYTRTISSRMINEARFNITRWGFDMKQNRIQMPISVCRASRSKASLAIVSGSVFPEVRNTPGVIAERQLDFHDIVTRTFGNQVMKFGAEYRKDENSNGEIGAARPLYSMAGLWNLANGTPIFEQITADANGKPSANNTKFHTGELAFFVQDDWKFRPNLTFNLGLRWSYYSPITADQGVLGNLIPDANGGLAGGGGQRSLQLKHSPTRT